MDTAKPGELFYADGITAVPAAHPGGRWAVVDYAGVTRLRARRKSAARRFARKRYVGGQVRRWRRA